MDRICSRCGCSTFHYNRTRMRMECDGCGAPQNDEQQTQQLMQFDRSYAHAMEHLRVGNWDTVISILRPLTNQYPAEKKLHLAIFRAATKDFSDLEMFSSANRSIASEAWNRLYRLNYISGDMMRYSRRLSDIRREKLAKDRNRIVRSIFLAALFSLLAALCFYSTATYCGLICLICMGKCLYNLFESGSLKLLRQNKDRNPDYRKNPFT